MNSFRHRLCAAASGAIVVCGITCISSGVPQTRQSVDTTPESSLRDQVTPATIQAALASLERKRAKGPKPFYKPQEALEFFVEQRLAPGQTELSWSYLRGELDKTLLREQALVGLRGSGPPPGGITTWSALGPGNVGGRTRAIVFDPNDPNTMFAAGVAGGIWKSTDAGASWNVTDDLMLNLAVCSLAIDPTNSNLLYAGTGEGFFNDVFVQGLGIFKSTDAGATWNQLDGTVNGVPTGAFHYVNKIRISPNDPSRLYAATRTGVWRSLDAGQSWSVVLSNPQYLQSPSPSNGSPIGCTDLVVRSDRNPDTLFAVFGSGQADGLFRSLDGGDTWLAYGVPSNQGRMTLALAPSNNDILYLLMADNGSAGAFGQLVNIYRSSDGGDSFTAQIDFGGLMGPWLLSNLILATGCYTGFPLYSQGWYDNIIAVDPLDPDIVWVGGIQLFRSDDGGQNFGVTGFGFLLPPNQIHPDQHEITFHPDFNGTTNQIMYVGNDGGLHRTTNARAASSQEDCPLPPDEPLPQIVWENMNNGYGVTQFYHGDSAKDIDMFIGGCQDNGTNRVLALDTPNSWVRIFGGDGGYVAIDPTDSQTVYVEGTVFPDINKSTDGGDTFSPAINGITDADGVFITPFAMDQSNPNVLWTGGRRPWRTLNGAALWQPVGPDFSGPGSISAIAIAPSDGNIVYLGFNNGYIVRTTNGLDPSPTWTVFANGLIGGWVSSVAVDPQDTDIAYCTYSNYGISHVMRTVNGGLNWASIDGINFAGVPDIPAHWIAVRPCDSQQLYVGTELGVFVSDDGGGSWQPANTGLAHTVVESLDFKDDDTLVAFTHGRGVFVTNLIPCDCMAGDVNGDALFDLADVGPFTEVLLDPSSATSEAFCAADLNVDGQVDGLDVQHFLDDLLS